MIWYVYDSRLFYFCTFWNVRLQSWIGVTDKKSYVIFLDKIPPKTTTVVNERESKLVSKRSGQTIYHHHKWVDKKKSITHTLFYCWLVIWKVLWFYKLIFRYINTYKNEFKKVFVRWSNMSYSRSVSPNFEFLKGQIILPTAGGLGRFLGSQWDRQLKFSAYASFLISWSLSKFELI